MIFRSPFPDVAIPDAYYPTFILQHAGERATDPVLIDGPSGRVLTLGAVADGARRVASSLVRRGFGKGDVLAICSPNLPEYAVAFHGAALAGGVVTTANPLYTAEELAFQLGDTRARFVVTVPPFLDKAREAARGTEVREVFSFGEGGDATPFAALLQGDGDVPPVSIDPARDLVALPYSSGTSGRPKGVMLTHRNLVAVTCQVERLTVGAGPRARTLGILPFFHIYGLVVLMNFPLYFGGVCVTVPRFDLEQCLALIQEHRLTHLYVVPPLVLALARHPLVAKYDLSSVELVNSGAAPLDAELQRGCGERLGCLVTQGYGMTETSLACHVTPQDPAMVRPGSVGVTLTNMEAKLADPVTGAALPPGERGEICVRGPNVMQGYLNNPQATAETIDAEGWLHTGDVGYADPEGFFYVVDRLKELIKYKGMQVAPAELEGILLAHPAIAD